MGKNTKKQIDNIEDSQNNLNQGLFGLLPIKQKSVIAEFTAEKISSDGGLLILREVENQIGIIQSIANCITDNRHPSYVEHPLYELLAQRVYQISAGYEDANDCNYLKDDPILKMCVGQLPETGKSLASQPTMSRFENQPTRTELYNIAVAFAEQFVRSYTSEPQVIILDCDDTNSDTYGGQQLTLFNDYYGEYCYMPLHIYEGLSGKLITTILKPGRRSKGADVFAILKRLISLLRKHWKNTTIVVRGDGHFASKELMDWAHDQRKIRFMTGLTGNSLLHKLSEVKVKSAESMFKQTGKPVKLYHSFQYQASSWEYSQRVIVKIEVNSMGTNIRYIVTDLHEYRTKELYEKGYCARGGMELRIKEHKLYLQSDRMSCNRFFANQMRLFLHSAAYVLIHTLQKELLRGTEYYNATMETIKLRLIKTATRVLELKTKIKVQFPIEFPTKTTFSTCMQAFEILRC